MLKIYTHFGLGLKKKNLRNSLFLFTLFCVFGFQSVSAQISFEDDFDVFVQCFNIEDFSADDLTTACSAGIASIDITIVDDDGTPDECRKGQLILNYSGETSCEESFSLNRAVIVRNPGLIVPSPQDVTISCDDNILSNLDLTQPQSTCANGLITFIDEVTEGEIDLCSEHVLTFRYTYSDDCETMERFQNITVVPDPVVLDVGDELVIVECTEDINVTADDITIDLPCGAEVINVDFTAPDLSNPSSTCDNRSHLFTWLVETTCGTFEVEKEFEIRNQKVRIIGAEDITISCLDHPLSNEALLEGLSLEHPCSNYPESGPIGLQRPDEDFPATFTEAESYTYLYTVQDACSGSDENASISVTVLPESPTITFDEEVTTISDLGLLLDDNFKLEGANAIPGCCEISEFGPIECCAVLVARGANGPGEIFQVDYRALDACGNVAFARRTFLFEPPVTLLEEEVTVECFNLDDFTEADLSTTCEEGFESVEIDLAVSSIDGVMTTGLTQCCTGTVTVNYSGFTSCGDEFSLDKTVIISNPGLSATIPEDITISCEDDFILPTADDVTANSPCGGIVEIEVSEEFIVSGACDDRTRRFTYTISDDCETINLTQTFTITQIPLVLDVGPQNVIVECADEIDVSEEDINIQLPCVAEIINIDFTEPDLSSPTASCDQETHVFTWEVETTCGNRTISKTFEVVNGGISEVEDVSISCIDYPLDVSDFVDLALTTSCGNDFDRIEGFFEVRGSLDQICTETEVTYQLFVTDVCGNGGTVRHSITVLPELPTITFDEEETTVTCIEQLGDEEFLLLGVNIDSPCSSVDPNGIKINTFQTDPGEDDSCNGVIFSVGYEVFDECGNSAEASKTFIVNNPDFSIEVAPDVTVECLEAISASPFDVTVNDICGNPQIDIRDEVIESNGCPGEIISVNYDIEFTCGTEITVSRNFTIGEQSLEPIVFDEEVIDGATFNFTCAEESEIDERLNANTVLFDEFFCNVSIDEARAKVCLEADFEKIELPSGNCAEDGFPRRFQFNWTLTDDCGRTGSVTVFANVVDETAPVLLGLPSDVTIGCEEEIPAAPEVFAEDDCGVVGEVEYIEEMSLVEVGAFTQKLITRTWSTSDECGNNTKEVRSIAIIDEESPELSFIDYKGEEIANGAIITIECDEDFDWVNDLDKNDIIAVDNCGCLHPEFQLNVLDRDEENTRQLKQLFIPKWTVSDEFGNTSEFSFSVRILDTKFPVFVGPDTLFICENDKEGFGFARDDCGNAFSSFIDYPIEGAPVEVFTRRFTMSDEVKNRAIHEQIAIDFSKRPQLIEFNEVLNRNDEIFACDSNSDGITPFSESDVTSRFDAYLSLAISFEEILLPLEADGRLPVELRWIATTPCGYADTITEMVYVLDETPPSFEAFAAQVAIDCINSVEKIVAIDACGLISLEYEDVLIEKGCGSSQIVDRVYTAIDASGNATTVNQMITVVDSLAPIFYEPEQTCASQAAEPTYAVDPCSNEKILATVVNDSLLFQCAEYVTRLRTLLAEDDCGNSTLFTQVVYEDGLELQYVITDPRLEALLATPEIGYEDVGTKQAIFNLDVSSVLAVDSCGNSYEGYFEREIVEYGDCDLTYDYKVLLKWAYLDICDIQYSYELEFKVLRAEIYVEPLINMTCSAEIPAVEIYGVSLSTPYSESTMDYRDEHGVGQVVRMINLGNYCGKQMTFEQVIEYEAGFKAVIVGEMAPACASGASIPYEVEVEGGIAPYEVEWVAAESCEITTVSALGASILFTESQTALAAIVTDATGCAVRCEAVVSCYQASGRSSNLEHLGDLGDLELQAFPNPLVDLVRVVSNANVQTEYSYFLYDHLGKLQQRGKGEFTNGSSFELNLSGFASGVYYLSIENEGRQETLKIIKI